MRAVIVFAGLALAAAGAVPRYLDHTGGTTVRPVPAALAARTAPPADAAMGAANRGSAVIPRDERGHFQVDGRVDGRRIKFMVDTGASVIALTTVDAAAIGIHPAQREFVLAMNTANGNVRAAPARLDMVEIGGVLVHDVAAVVMPDMALSESLLGMSFLSRLRRFEYGEGKLMLEQ
jgi:aspartyl protease family protein